MLYLVWNRPTETTQGTPIPESMPLTYEVFSGNSLAPVNVDPVTEVAEARVAFPMLGSFEGKYHFVRAKTLGGTVSDFSQGILLGIPKSPKGLRVEDQM